MAPIDPEYEEQETIILYNIDPERWDQLQPHTQARMIAHYRERQLRESHLQAVQKKVSEEMKNKNGDSKGRILDPLSGWSKQPG